MVSPGALGSSRLAGKQHGWTGGAGLSPRRLSYQELCSPPEARGARVLRVGQGLAEPRGYSLAWQPGRVG